MTANCWCCSDPAAVAKAQFSALLRAWSLRTKDAYDGIVKHPEVEDLLRDTLVHVAKSDFGWDIAATAAAQPGRPIVDIFADEIVNFSKYRLAKAFLRWTRDHEAAELSEDERRRWKKLIEAINAALK